MKFKKNKTKIGYNSKSDKECKLLKSANVSLKKIIKEKDLELKSLREQLHRAKESNSRKLEFITHLSHELKTPLNAIVGFTSLMEEKELPREKQLRFHKNILSASKHMLHISEYTIDMARAETDKLRLDYTEFLPLDVIKEVLSILGELIAQKHINVITRFAGIPIIADKRRFKQLIYNLIGNAIKFNKIGGTIKISTSVNDNIFTFEISDTGIGISPEEQDKIFEFFSNISVLKLCTEESTGVGLSLCRKIVNLHNGEINFSSECGKGSIFRFSMPLKPHVIQGYFEYLKV